MGAGPAHIWMKNIWAPSLFLCVHERLSADTGGWRPKHQHTDWPGSPEFHRLTLPEDDGSVQDDLDRDPRPPDCLWVLPDFWAVSLFSSELEGREEGMTERRDVLFWKSYSDPLSWLKWLYSTWRNTRVIKWEWKIHVAIKVATKVSDSCSLVAVSTEKYTNIIHVI